MHRADPRPKVLLAAAPAAGCCRYIAGPAMQDQHGSERRAENRQGVQGHSPGTPFLTQAKKYSVFYLFCCLGGGGRRVA